MCRSQQGIRVIRKNRDTVRSHNSCNSCNSWFKKESNAMFDTKKDIWKFIIQVLAAIITAAGTALGTTSCMGAF